MYGCATGSDKVHRLVPGLIAAVKMEGVGAIGMWKHWRKVRMVQWNDES